jgi:hypothetical protein
LTSKALRELYRSFESFQNYIKMKKNPKYVCSALCVYLTPIYQYHYGFLKGNLRGADIL